MSDQNITLYRECDDSYRYNRLTTHFDSEVYATSLRRYEYELSQSEVQNNHVATYITILSLIIVGFAIPISNYRDAQLSNNITFCLLILFFIFSFIFTVIATINIYRHQIQKKRGYSVINSPNDIKVYYEDYYKYYVDNEFLEKSFTSPEKAANIALVKELIIRYNQCTDNNIKHNEFKLNCLRALKLNLLIAVFFFALGFTCFQLNKTDSITKISVVK